VLPEGRGTDPAAVASQMPKPVQDRLVSNSNDEKIPPARKSTTTAKAALSMGGVSAVAPTTK
jgi:hypothetical protein